MPAARILAGCAVVLAATASACSSSKPTATGATTTVVSEPGSTALTGPTTPSTLFVQGAVPAVTGGSDLTKEPTIAAGSGNPPTVLTGKDLVVGTGTQAVAHETVEVQYVGALYSTGKVFDASWTDSGPASFSLDQVVPGFSDAIIGMRIGGRREIVIPPALGYGASGSGSIIPPNSTLVFVIDLLKIVSS